MDANYLELELLGIRVNLDTNYLESEWICPLNGSAVRHGSRSSVLPKPRRRKYWNFQPDARVFIEKWCRTQITSQRYSGYPELRAPPWLSQNRRSYLHIGLIICSGQYIAISMGGTCRFDRIISPWVLFKSGYPLTVLATSSVLDSR